MVINGRLTEEEHKYSCLVLLRITILTLAMQAHVLSGVAIC